MSVEIADAIRGARVVIIPDCGHLPQPEQPHDTADALVDWLRN
jgi:pimeloyl-ACP methyl ester carboxylesterase